MVIECEYCNVNNPDEAQTCSQCGAALPPPDLAPVSDAVKVFWEDLNQKLSLEKIESFDETIIERNLTWLMKKTLKNLTEQSIIPEKTASIIWTMYRAARAYDEKDGIDFNDDNFDDDKLSLSKTLYHSMSDPIPHLYNGDVIPENIKEQARNMVDKLFGKDGPLDKIKQRIILEEQKPQWKETSCTPL